LPLLCGDGSKLRGRVVEATNDRLGVVYGELECVVQLLGEERTKLERLLFSRGPAG
jgi:hypothetical protein